MELPSPRLHDGPFVKGLNRVEDIIEVTSLSRRTVETLIKAKVLRPVAADHLRVRLFLRDHLNMVFSVTGEGPAP